LKAELPYRNCVGRESLTEGKLEAILNPDCILQMSMIPGKAEQIKEAYVIFCLCVLTWVLNHGHGFSSSKFGCEPLVFEAILITVYFTFF
jgi:hypothetical protein